MKTERKATICYVLSYRSPDYIRTLVLLKALSGMDAVCLSKAVNTARGSFRYVQTLLRLLQTRITERPHAYLLGFRGYELFWPVRLMTRGRPLIVDHMMSPYDSLLNERRILSPNSLLAKWTFLYERAVLRHADAILTDTPLHKTFLCDLFSIPPSKVHTIPVGTDEDLFSPQEAPLPSFRQPPLQVFFYGTFLPLHGIPVILDAAKKLGHQPVQFTLVGGNGRDRERLMEAGKRQGLRNVIHHSWVNLQELPRWIARADVCLGGPFGNTGQARRVVTGKTYQFLAMAKPTVVGKIDEDDGFRDKENCLLVPQGDGQALAEAIAWALANRERLNDIGKKARSLYLERFSIRCIKASLAPILDFACHSKEDGL